MTLSAILPPAEIGGHWTAVGTVTSADGATSAAIWLSEDGLAWHAVDLGGADGRALAATEDGSATVVVGSVGTGTSQRAAVWMTPAGGGTPQLVPDQSSLQSGVGSSSTAPAGASEMDLVAAGTIGIVASGSVAGRPAVWYSTDGTDWAQEPSLERLVADRHARLTSLLVDPTGALATAVADQGTVEEAVAWDSPDGIRWTSDPAGTVAAPGDHVVDDVVWTGEELVGVGGTRTSSSWSPEAWVSPATGAASDSIEAFPSASSTLRSVSVDPIAPSGAAALVAVGGAAGRPQAFESTDGETWTDMSMPAPPADEGSATADLVATWGTTTVVADSQPGQPLVWVRRSGRWTSVPAASFGALRPTAEAVAAVEASGRLWLAVDLDRPGSSPAEEAIVLDSVHGRHWYRAAAIPGARLSDLATAGAGLVATGIDETTGAAAVWSSADGRAWHLTSDLSRAASPEALTTLGATDVVVGTTPLAGRGAPVAATWESTGATHGAPRTLDAVPTIDASQALGICSSAAPAAGSTPTTTEAAGPTGTSGSKAGTPALVVVGWSTRTGPPPAPKARRATATTVPVAGSGTGVAGQTSNGTEAATWSTSGATTWSPGSVSPRAGVGSEEEMLGCAATADGFVAWGQATGTGGSQPALWTSTDGRSWTRVLPARGRRASKAPVGPGGPWTSVAISGADWLAVGGSPPADLALPTDPARSFLAADPSAARASSTADGSGGVWLSTDSGIRWQLLSGDVEPWSGRSLSTTVAAWAGSSPVVAGDLGGAVAVWVGVPAS